MESVFKAIRLQASRPWAVVLTTHEGDDHCIDGFRCAADARAWIESETGQRLISVGQEGAIAREQAA